MKNLKISVTNKDSSETELFNGTISQAIQYINSKKYIDCNVTISERIFDSSGDVISINRIETISY